METGRTKPRRVLVFNKFKRFVGVYASQLQAAKAIGVQPPTVKAACDGKAISTCSLYLRWWRPDIEIDIQSELGELNLKEYDDLCGVDRKVYKDSKMNRKNWKYNMKATPKKLKKLGYYNESTSNQQLN